MLAIKTIAFGVDLEKWVSNEQGTKCTNLAVKMVTPARCENYSEGTKLHAIRSSHVGGLDLLSWSREQEGVNGTFQSR